MKWRCPICRRETDSDADREFPFCSERCRNADLGNWAAERYRISEPALEEPAGDAADPDETKP
jgi:endogenous inhibitor of DNA gyrase (YacG/DUF329 family)